MVRFTFAPASFAEILREMAVQFGVPLEETCLRFPPMIGEGYLKYIDLPNGLDALIGDFTLKQGMLIERANSGKEYYVFVCDIARGVSRFYVDIDQHRVETNDQELSSMYLLSFLSDFSQYASAGTHMQTVRVIITRDWLAKYLKIDVIEEVLQRYLSLKAGSVHVKEVDFESRTFMEEVLHPPADTPMEKTYIQNRIMMLIENFFGWLYQQMSVMELKIRLTREEIEQMMRVEEQLVANLAAAPTINQLARDAAMSPSKLKKQFKDVFGLPVYEHFQKKRMQKARELLLEGRRSVKSVGIELGFSNLSNFSMAFRKEFNELPSALLKSGNLT